MVVPGRILVAPEHILVAPTEAAAWTDLPLGIPKDDAWLVQESGHTEYKDLQSDQTNKRIDDYLTRAYARE